MPNKYARLDHVDEPQIRIFQTSHRKEVEFCPNKQRTTVASHQTVNLTKTCWRIILFNLIFNTITVFEKALPDEHTEHNAFS